MIDLSESEMESEPFQSSGPEYVPEQEQINENTSGSKDFELIQEPTIPTPKKCRSEKTKFTDFFTVEQDLKSTKKSDKRGKCTLCKLKPTVIKMKNSGTSSLKRHLQSKHIKVYENFFGNAEQSICRETSSANTNKDSTISSWLSDSGSTTNQKIVLMLCTRWNATNSTRKKQQSPHEEAYRSLARGISVASSVFTITAMAVDRYLAITQPFGFCRWFNKKTTVIVIIVLWITSMIVFAPLLFVARLNEDVVTENISLLFCQETWEDFYLSREIFGIVCYVVMFAVPGAIMLWAYSLMGKKLCSVRPPFDNEGSCSTQQSYRLVRERKRVAWILLLLALMFAFCWLPYNTINLLIDTRNVKTRDVVESLADLKQYMLLLGHANSALNPIIYCVMSRNFRRSVKEIIFFTRINLVSKQSQRMQWVDSSGSTLRPNQQKMKMLPTLHNKRQLSRLQSSQKTTKTCAV